MYSSKIQANEEIITRLLYRNMYRTMITYHTDMFILYIYMYNQMNTWDSQKFQIKRVLLFIDTDISWGSGSLNLCQVFFFVPFCTTETRHRNHYDVMFCSSPLTTATTMPRSLPQEDSIKVVHSSSKTSFIHAGTTSESNWKRKNGA